MTVELTKRAVDGETADEHENVSWALAELDALLRPALVDDVLGRRSAADISATVAALWERVEKTLPPRRRWHAPYDAMSRALDVVLALVLMALTAPVVAVLALLIRLEDGGPSLFPHTRVTRGGRTFRCWKLRTMRGESDAAADDPVRLARYVFDDFKIRADDDARITRLGRFLRATFLDELPQLWNVLRGDMALVGPRPVVAAELRWYGPLAEELTSVRPGLTGAWQLTDDVTYPHRAWLELAYVRSRSLALDAEILVRTLLTVTTRSSWPLERLAPPPSEVPAELIFSEPAPAADA